MGLFPAANSNWSEYECSDSIEGESEGDNTERVLIENNVFEDITAEGADLKEGTDSGTIRNNVFRRAGISGQNSADSAIDAKGNDWLTEANIVAETDAYWDDDGVARSSEFADGFQSHSVYDGFGTGNVFRANRVEGAIPGFGIGLYPAFDTSSPVTTKPLAPARDSSATTANLSRAIRDVSGAAGRGRELVTPPRRLRLRCRRDPNSGT